MKAQGSNSAPFVVALASWRLFGLFSGLAIVAFLERAFLDWRYVYVDLTPDVATTGLALATYVLLVGAWLWALAGVARRSRRGVIAVVCLTAVLLVAMSIGTMSAFCPSPCSTAWPLMEASNWFGLVVGFVVCAAGVALLVSERWKEA
jgi:hypothetical protein